MLCPRTKTQLKEYEIGGVKVDVSEACGGVWFDNFELEKFDTEMETDGEELLQLLEKFHKPVTNLDQRLNSPRHPEVVMMRRFFSPARKVVIDVCPKCNGIWLDPGELAEIRSLYKTDAEQEKAGEVFVNEVCAEGLATLAAESQESAASARRFANLFRWLCPSNYIKGDQSWGAF